MESKRFRIHPSTKGTVFTEAEKQELGMISLVPDGSEPEDVQLRCWLLRVAQKKTGLELLPLVKLLDQQPKAFLPNHH
jgi:malate dehydrogenase (oxaloacetate-decarboxylating)(NADP+)